MGTDGTFRGACIINDERQAQVNAVLAANINGGRYEHINMLSVDNVCNNGPQIFAALEKFVARPDFQKKFSNQRLSSPDANAFHRLDIVMLMLTCFTAAALSLVIVSLRRWRFTANSNGDGHFECQSMLHGE